MQIDGSYGEGGGQIIRYSIALSVLLKKPVEIINIRAKRPNPGLRPQHLTAISCMKTLCDAETKGLSIGSSKLTFIPRDIKVGEYRFDIGTAGSITLVFQACILCALKSESTITLQIKGGTDVKWSPSWDYFTNIFLSLLQKMGIKIETKLIARGYYPKGGGEAVIKLYPIKKISPIKIEKIQNFNKITGKIHISNLPDHISKRIKHTAIQQALKNDHQTSIKIEESSSLCPGVGITLWSMSNSNVLGSCVIGERGIPAEQIGFNAVNQLIEEINSNSTIDYYALDQLLPYMVIAGEKSTCCIRKLSNHANTTIWLLKQFFNANFQLIKQNNCINLVIN